jgi:5S rRNA maturation endonuclease (ribonuclease M5)
MKLSKDQLFSILQNPKMWKNDNIIARCPWCGRQEFYISLKENNPWQCFRKNKCEADKGRIHKLLDHLGIEDQYTIKETVERLQTLPNALETIEKQSLDIELEEVKLPIGFKRIYDDNYLNNRSFIKEDYDNYFIGITNLDRKLANYVIFTIYQDYKQVAYIGRYKGTKEQVDRLKLPRYKNSDSDFSKILGNYDDIEKEVTETVILVEGIFDAHNVTKLLNLKNNPSTKCGYTFKCHISDEQLYKLQLKEVKKILLLYDSDVISKVKETAIKLSKHFEVQVAFIECLNEDGGIKDPGDLNLHELNEVLNNTTSALNFNFKKVQLLNL